MHHVGLAPLAGAVSKAGGLGIVTALSLPTPEKLRDEIRKARDIAGKNKPIGVNLTLLPTLVPPDYDAYVNVVVEEGVPVIETAGHVNGLKKFVDRLKAEGRFIMHKCTSVRHAKSAQKLGVDMISMDGFGKFFCVVFTISF
jgi:NAD(P)H-dependent flavin oxidoreductase YrpB (nitropropane dioxygenase family)